MSPVIRTCKACEIDVSLPLDESADARCPQCDEPLTWPTNPQGDATDKTLLEVKPSAASSEEGPAATAAGRASDEGRPLSETATLRDGPAAPPSTGARARKRLGPYELRQILGKGGMGVVYEAFQTDLERTVALKVMSGREVSDEEFLRFKREARAAAKLKHPNIVPIHEVGEHDGCHYFTMDLVRGRTLQDFARSGQLEPEETARLMAKVARAIHYAHEQDIIHRDLKPSNIIVDTDGEPHVMDFGLAKDLSDVSGLTLSGVAMGSPPYMPPEQARGDFRSVDAVSDVYGLGATLYECLTGKPPFGGKSLYDIIAKVLVEDPPSPKGVNPQVPYDLETICLKGLEKEKWRRYPTALDMALDLERFAGGHSIRAVRQGLTTRVGRVIARHRLQIFSMLIPGAVMAALAAYAFGGDQEIEPREVVTHEYKGHRGNISRTAEHLVNGDEEALAILLSDRRMPAWDRLEASLEPFLKYPRVKDAWRRAQREGDESAVPSKQVAGLALALVKTNAVTARELAGAVEGWFERDPGLARLACRTALALRAAKDNDIDAWKLALTGPLTPLDRSILQGAARVLFANDFEKARDALTPKGSPQRTLEQRGADPLPPPVGRPGVVRAYDRPVHWSFPSVRLPGERGRGAADRTLVRGLLARGSTHQLNPTAGLRTPRGDRVVVAWLRFAYLLDDERGGVLARRRLPGLADALEYDPEGGYRVRVWRAGDSGWYRLRLDEGPNIALTTLEGATVPALDLLPEDAQAVPSAMRRVACALFPELDDLIEVREVSSDEEHHDVRHLRYSMAPGSRLELGFIQGSPDRTPTALARRDHPHRRERLDLSGLEETRITQVVADSGADEVGLQVGDYVLRLVVVGEGRLAPKLRVWVVRQKEGKRQRMWFSYTPTREITAEGWRSCVKRGRDHILANRDANPWVRAFLAVSLLRLGASTKDEARQRLLGAEGREAALEAVASTHLTPRELVELGCFLDRYELEDAADAAFHLALRGLVRKHAFIPGWAGYGPLDCGRVLTRRVEHCRLIEKRLERAAALTRWRDAFAPALADSRFAREVYRKNDVHELPEVDPADRLPPDLPEELRERPLPKGIAGLNAMTLQRIDHAVRLQAWFLFSLGGLLLITFARYRRHAIRGLDRVGVVGFAARHRMWLERPWTRLRYAWPMYFTLHDKLSFVVLYLLFFGIFAFQDAGLDTLVAQKRAREPMLAGVPGEPSTLAWLEERVEQNPTPEAVYSLAWVRLARGLPVQDGTRDLLREDRAPRAALLLGEILAREGNKDGAVPLLEAARSSGDEQLSTRASLLLARLEGDDEQVLRLADELAEASPRLGQARWAGDSTVPLSPSPTIEDRDRLLLGTDDWSKRLPKLLLRNLVQPFPERMDASISTFEESYNWNLSLARLHNRWFFLVPGTLVLLVASLFMPIVHPFEPLEIDLRPPPAVRILALLFPGMPQFQRGRPVRGVLLLLPFFYMIQTLHHAWTGTVLFSRVTSFSTNLSPVDTAALTGETVSAVSAVQVHHLTELALILLGIYVLHWVDLVIAQRKVFSSAEGEGSSGKTSRLIIPLDSEAGAPPPPETTERQGSDVGPFDKTERELPPPGSSDGEPGVG